MLEQKAAAINVLIILLLAYLLTFSGVPSTDDEQLYVVITGNLAFGNGYTALPLFGNDRLQGATSGVEPLHPFLGIPLFLLAGQLGLGKAQILFLLPLLYSALTGYLLVIIACKSGASQKTAAVLGLSYGLGTIALPYARTNFREPLCALFITLAVLYQVIHLEQQKSWKRSCFFLLLSFFFLALSSLVKVITTVLIPVFLIFDIVQMKLWRKEHHKKLLLIIISLVIFISMAFLFFPAVGFNRFSVRFVKYILYTIPRLPHDHFWQALMGLLISPGKGLFIYSPLLILSLCSLGMRNVKRPNWLLYMSAASLLAIVQALIYNDRWWSITWGTRALLPVLPLVALAALPALDTMLIHKKKWVQTVSILLFIAGFIIQISRLLVSDPVYANWAVQSTGRSINSAAQWDLSLMPLIRHWMLSGGRHTSDIAWLHIFNENPFLIAALITVGLSGITVSFLQLFSRRTNQTICISMVLSVCIALFLTPIAIRNDPRYYGSNPSYQDSVNEVCSIAGKDDLVLVDAYLKPFWWFYLNFGCSGSQWIGLPYLHETAIQEDFFFPRIDEVVLLIRNDIKKGNQVYLVQEVGDEPLTYQDEFVNRGLSVKSLDGLKSLEPAIFIIK